MAEASCTNLVPSSVPSSSDPRMRRVGADQGAAVLVHELKTQLEREKDKVKTLRDKNKTLTKQTREVLDKIKESSDCVLCADTM